jgi:hypothetical protein
MSADERKKIYAALAAPFKEDCIQRTEGSRTGKGYDTSGIGYQHICNRLNEVLGVGCFRAHRTVTVKEISRSSGKSAFEAICDLTLELGEYVDGQFVTFAESLADGGHIAGSEADARKGAYTNAFKKAAAFFGVGRQAYEGSLDDDNVPIDEIPGQSRRHLSVAPARTQPRPQAQHDLPPPASALPAPTAPSLPAPAAQTTSGPTRNRLTSNQLSAIWSLSRKLGWAQSEFRARVKQKYGVTLEFLDRASASKLISELQLQPVPNGHAGEMPAEPGAAG